jgi:hypothetical protein
VASGESEVAGAALKPRRARHPRPWPQMPSWVTRLSVEAAQPGTACPFLCQIARRNRRGLFRDVTALRPIYSELQFRALFRPGSRLSLHFDQPYQTSYSGLEDCTERFKSCQDGAAYVRPFDSTGIPHYGGKYPGSVAPLRINGGALTHQRALGGCLFGGGPMGRGAGVPRPAQRRPVPPGAGVAARLEEGAYFRLAEHFYCTRPTFSHGPLPGVFSRTALITIRGLYRCLVSSAIAGVLRIPAALTTCLRRRAPAPAVVARRRSV